MKLLDAVIERAIAQTPNTSGTSGIELKDFNFLKLWGGSNNTQFDSLFTRILGIVLTIAALVAFFYLLAAGFQYITAGGDSAKAQLARQGILNALIGIIIIVISFAVLRYVGGFVSAP